MRRTTIYLDVDGVLNAVPKHPRAAELSGWTGVWREALVEAEGRDWRINWSTEFVDRLNALAARQDVEVRWLTTWRDWAPRNLAPALGLDGAEWAVTPETGEMSSGWWKYAALVDDLAGRERVVWIDDDHTFYADVTRALIAERADSLLVVTPNTNLGVTRAELERVETFVDA